MHRMYADFSDEAYEDMVNGEAKSNNGFRKNDGSFHPDQPDFVEIEDDDDTEDNSSDGNSTAQIIALAVGVGIAIGAVAAPHVKRLWNETIVPGVKNIYSKITGKKTAATKQSVEGHTTSLSVAERTGVTAQEFSKNIDIAVEGFKKNMSSEEAQMHMLNITKLTDEEFNQLTSDERVRHVIEQSEYYGYSGDRVKGLIFCSRVKECEELSRKFNALDYRTVALSGDDKEEKRQEAFERLAMYEADATEDMQPLDYIFSRDILNEGVDIVEVNQIIMLIPTQSPIVFIQQLGRGLRKAPGKEYVVILDFIGNYNNNFMIPVALSGDRTYNADVIRKYVISGNSTIPGASTVHFDEVSKDKIFKSIDKIKGMQTITKVTMKMHHAVRDDLLRYLQSNITA